MRPDVPDNEAERLSALRELEILDTEPDPAFDALVELAATITGVPIALVSLVEDDRQWFKARVGLEAQQTSRDVSFCGHAIASGEALVVPDATVDARFRENPLVTGDPRIRFYAGIPLKVRDNLSLGTLCVIDREPRELDADTLELLSLLGEQVVHLLNKRREHRQLREERELIRELYTIASSPNDAETRIRRVLEVGCERFGAELGIVSEIVDEVYTVEYVEDRAELGLGVGTKLPLGKTFCNIVLATNRPVHIAHVGRSTHVRHPAYQATHLESYIGARVFVDDNAFGTLNFSSRSARDWSFTENDVEALQLMAAWVGAELGRMRARRERDELIAELQAKIAQITSLEALIPICSWCKKVRDDAGAWTALEGYFQEYTGAVFSHGICPSCNAEHFNK